MNRNDALQILGVEPTSTQDEIRQAYRGLASKHHPDHGGDAKAFARFQVAYELLIDSQNESQPAPRSQATVGPDWMPGVPPNPNRSPELSFLFPADWAVFRRAFMLIGGLFLLVSSGLPGRVYHATVSAVQAACSKPLPPGVSRGNSCPGDVTLGNCRMAKITFVYEEDGSQQFVFLKKKGNELSAEFIKPSVDGKRLSELRVGDSVIDRNGNLGRVAKFEIIR